jgi:hypothetical protein
MRGVRNSAGPRRGRGCSCIRGPPALQGICIQGLFIGMGRLRSCIQELRHRNGPAYRSLARFGAFVFLDTGPSEPQMPKIVPVSRSLGPFRRSMRLEFTIYRSLKWRIRPLLLYIGV